ncbi:MAG: class I SAM-dependent methyltransferase [Gammaproteobacteria bacterium]|nr:class I SAM-dependent methyltransferase [Gammaproteobacteria bacterium]
MDWVLFNNRCGDLKFFLDLLEKSERGLLAAKQALFISKIFIEVSRSACSGLSEIQLALRKALWENNFGVPTLDFLLINKTLIHRIAERILDAPEADVFDLLLSGFEHYQDVMQKKDRGFLYQAYDTPAPDGSESMIVTMNNQGFMTTKAADPFSMQFIEAAKQSSVSGGKVLEIGAAYGVATLSALNHGATVFCNDLEPAHLAVAAKEHIKLARGHLVPIPGAFPDEFVFEPKLFDAILIARVLHFFEGEDVVQSLKKARAWLKPGGRLFLVNETPFLSNWRNFLGEYEARKKRGDKWPGLINNPQEYEQGTLFLSSLPPLMHFFDKETLEQALLLAGFEKENIQVEYINRAGQFPPKLLMSEKQQESVGCKAIKSG